MTSKTATALAAGLLLSLAGSPAPAEEIPLTLGEALARAEGNNPDILAARQRAAAQGSRIESVERLRWPRLDVTMGWSRTNTPAMVFMGKLNAGEFTQNDFAIDSLNSPDPLSHLMTVLSVMAPVDLAGKVKAMSSAQAAVERAMQAGTLEMLQEIRVRVVEAYRNAELAARAVALTQRALEGALARERDIQARVEEGAALQADLLRARSRRRQREADLAERRGQRRMAQAALARLLGAEPGTLFDPIEAPVAPAPIDGDLASWTQRALERRPVFTATQEKREAARWMRTAEDRALLPDIGVFGQVQDDRNSFSGGKQNWAFGAMLKWGAFDPGRSKRLAAAQADERAAELETRSAADQIRLDVEMAYRRAESARERYAAAAGGAEEGREALRVLQERRQSGMATLTDELEAETASLGAELAEIQAASEAALADAALRRATGELWAMATRKTATGNESNEEKPMRTRISMGRRPGTLALAGAALAGLTLAGCARHETQPAPEAPAGPAVAVETAEVTRTAEGTELLVPAVVQARNSAALSARIPASVVELPFRVGDRVAAGDVVVRLDDAALQSALLAAEAAAKAAETDLARTQALVAKGAATQRELDQANAGAAGARAMLSGARDSLSYAALRAPFAGSVAQRNVSLGDVVAPGRPLIEIEAAGGFEIRATVESEALSLLKPGLKVMARVDGVSEPTPATLRSISPAGDPATHRFEVKADLAQAPGLRSGLFARLVLPSPTAAARLLVPEAAVFRRGGLFGVYVVADGRARLRWVAVGETTAGLTEIRAGVSATERVALAPAELSDGTPVEEKR